MTEWTLDQLADACGGYLTENRRATKPHKQRSQPDPGLDTPSNISQATKYLENAKPSIQGDGGHDRAFKVSAMVRDFGISEPLSLMLMLDYWNERCSPPWSPDELQTIIGHAYRYGQNTPGSKAASTEFSPVAPETPPTPRQALYVVHYRDAKPNLKRRALVKNTLGFGGCSVLYGDSNAGKSFFALDLALHIATNIPWNGLKVHQAGAIYIAAEAGGSFLSRVAAWKKAKETPEAPFAVIPCAVDLRSPKADTKALIALVKETEALLNHKVEFIVVDTLARALAGGNENASEDMGAFIDQIDRLRHATGAHVLIVHHTGKDKAKGARGHSSLRAAMDTEMEIDDARRVYVTKQRDFEGGAEWAFDLEKVDLGHDEDGELLSSCVVRPVDGGRDTFDQALKSCQGDKKANRRYALLALKAAVERSGQALNGPYTEVSLQDWRTEFSAILEEKDGHNSYKNGGIETKHINQSFKRAIVTILQSGWVCEVQGKEGVTLNFR